MDIHYGLFFILTLTLMYLGASRLKKYPKILRWLTILYITTFCLFQLFLLKDHSTYDATVDYDYIIVLGSGLKNDRIQPTLEYRLKKALEVLTIEDCPVILSGGLGNEKQRNEAEAMAAYLTQEGIPAHRILQDNRATSTWENLINSQALMAREQEAQNKVLIVSSNFHLPRARLLAGRLGLEVDTLGAEVPFIKKMDDHSREYYAFIKSLLLDWSKNMTFS